MAMLKADNHEIRRLSGVVNGFPTHTDGVVISNSSNNSSNLGPSMADEEETRGNQGCAEKKSSLSTDDQEWLQLSIGGGSECKIRSNINPSNPVETPSRGNTSSSDIGYLLGSEIPFLLQQQQGMMIVSSNPENMMTTIRPAMAAPPSSYFQPDFRVIQAPRRAHSGIWFKLQASQNQEKEACLPQISKSYLRIKDGRMTIRVVIKYLANKLRLENIESQIEIRCGGERVAPCLSLQHVRDNIWRRSSSSSSCNNFITCLPNSSTANHIMLLQYMHAHADADAN